MEGLYEYGYLGLFLASFLAATILPFSSEALLTLMIVGGFDPVKCLITATAGNWLGGMSGYALGYVGKWEWIEKYLRVKPEKMGRVKKRLDKYGAYIAFLCWLPAIGDLLAIGLGLIRSNVWQVAIFMFIGKASRYVLWAWLSHLGREAMF